MRGQAPEENPTACNSNYDHHDHNCPWLKSEDGHVLHLLSLTLPLVSSHLTSDCLHMNNNKTKKTLRGYNCAVVESYKYISYIC